MNIVFIGGHHSTAMPVVKLIRESNPDLKIFWVGHRHSLKGDTNDTLEYKEITSLGIPFFELKAAKVYKSLSLSTLIKLPLSFFNSLIYLFKIKPKVVVSFGGYLAVPVVLASWVLRVPVITHEQTVVIGYANKFISKFASKIFISWENSKKFLEDSPKVEVIGLPIRKSVFEVKSNVFELNENLPTIYITGGKTGAHVINMAINSALGELLKICNVIHQCGDFSGFNDYESLRKSHLDIVSRSAQGLTSRNLGKYYLEKFIMEDNIGEVFSKSSVVVSRGGAHTVAELKSLQKYCVIIPIPWVSHNEQFENAKVLQEEGLGIILEEKDLNPTTLIKCINASLSNEPRHVDVNVESIVYPSERIHEEILKYAKP